MLNEERVKTMTKLQILQDSEGEKIRPMAEYFRGDYVGRQLLISILSGTVLFLMVFLLFYIDDIEQLINAIDFGTIMEIMKTALTHYILFMVFYLILTFIIYTIRYARGRKKIRKVYAQLSLMEKLYQEEEDRQKPTGGMEE